MSANNNGVVMSLTLSNYQTAMDVLQTLYVMGIEIDSIHDADGYTHINLSMKDV